MNTYFVHSSPAENSLSRIIGLKLLNRLNSDNTTYSYLDNVKFVDSKWLSKGGSEEGDTYINNIINSDTLVIASPIYNLTVPAILKAWIDQIVVMGKTFTYENGVPTGLLKNKKAYIVVTSGTPMDTLTQYGMNHFEPYLKSILRFIGITDVTFFAFSARTEEDRTKEIERAEELFSKM